MIEAFDYSMSLPPRYNPNRPIKLIETSNYIYLGQLYLTFINKPYSDPELNIPEGMGIMYFFERKDFSSRSLFEGWFVNGRLNGYGRWLRQDKQRYTGDFYEGLKTGIGKYEWPTGAWQQGSWIDGQMNGQGEYHYEDGEVYEGEWTEDKMNGEGT